MDGVARARPSTTCRTTGIISSEQDRGQAWSAACGYTGENEERIATRGVDLPCRYPSPLVQQRDVPYGITGGMTPATMVAKMPCRRNVLSGADVSFVWVIGQL